MAKQRAAQRGAPPSAIAAVLLIIGLVGAAAYLSVRIQTIDHEIRRKRGGLKNLHLAGKVPPNEQVQAYLDERSKSLQQRYAVQLRRVAIDQTAAASGDTQMAFQETVHEVQNTLNRLTSARGMAAPSLLGLPKELPPASAARRMLLQLGLIKETGEALLEIKGISQLVSFKVEDPQMLPPPAEGEEAFLSRLPVRIRLIGSLDAFSRALTALERAVPMVDYRLVRLAVVPAPPLVEGQPAAPSRPQTQQIDVELVVARYLASASQDGAPNAAEAPPKRPGKSSGAKPPT